MASLRSRGFCFVLTTTKHVCVFMECAVKYLKEVQFGMDYLADDARTIFVGQAMQPR